MAGLASNEFRSSRYDQVFPSGQTYGQLLLEAKGLKTDAFWSWASIFIDIALFLFYWALTTLAICNYEFIPAVTSGEEEGDKSPAITVRRVYQSADLIREQAILALTLTLARTTSDGGAFTLSLHLFHPSIACPTGDLVVARGEPAPHHQYLGSDGQPCRWRGAGFQRQEQRPDRPVFHASDACLPRPLLQR